MSDKKRLITNEDQFRSKKAGRQKAAEAPFEEKVAKLVELQRLGFQLAQKSGRPGKRPWQIEGLKLK